MSTEASAFASILGIFAGIFFVIVAVVLVLLIIIIVSTWKLFTKAGQPGWAAIVPIYNSYILVQVARLPIYYFVIILVPMLVNIAKVTVPEPVDTVINIVTFITYSYITYNVAKQFGKGIGYTIGLVFLPFIFYPMLAFGDSVYLEQASSDTPVAPVAPTAVEQSTQVPVVEPAPQVTEQPVTPTAPTSAPQ